MYAFRKSTLFIATLCAFAASSVLAEPSTTEKSHHYFGKVNQATEWDSSLIKEDYKDGKVFGGVSSIRSDDSDSSKKTQTGDVTLHFKKNTGNIVVDDIFGGGYSQGSAVSSSVGNTHIIIDTQDQQVMGGDIFGGGYTYHYTVKPGDSSIGAVTTAKDTLIEVKRGIAKGTIVGGGYASGYASAPLDSLDLKNEALYLSEAKVGHTHIIISGGEVTEAVVGGGKVRVNSEANDFLKGIATVESVHIEVTGGIVGGIIGGGIAQSGYNNEETSSKMRAATAVVNGDTLIEVNGGTVNKLYNADRGASLQITNDQFDGAIAGGGIAGYGGDDVANNRFTKVESKGDITIQVNNATINGSIYGGAISAAGHRDDGYNNGSGGIASVNNVAISVSNSTINGNIYAGGASVALQSMGEKTENKDKSYVYKAGSSEVSDAVILLGKGAKVTGDIYTGGAVFNVSDSGAASNESLLSKNTVKTTAVIFDSADVQLGGHVKNGAALQVDDGAITMDRTSFKTESIVAGTSNFNDSFESSSAAMARLIEWSDYSVSDLTLADGESNNTLTIKRNDKGEIIEKTEVLNARTEQFGKSISEGLITWRLEMNDLNKRMGELRDSEGNAGVWARVNAGKQKFQGSKNNFTTFQMGADAKIPVLFNTHAGLAFSYTDSDLSYVSGSGDNNVYGLAAYASWLGDSGSFLDLIAKVARVESDTTVAGTHADYNTNAYSVSAEIGHRFTVTPLVFVEPQLELSYGHVAGKSFDTVNRLTQKAVSSRLDGYDSLVGRVGFRTGLSFPEKKGNVYVRASVLREFQGDVTLTRGEGTYELETDDTWFEYGIGGNYNFTPAIQLYADLERYSGAELSEPWRVNVGARWSF